MLQRIDIPELVNRLLAKGYTTKALGDALGLSQPSVSRLARGCTESTSADVMVRLINLVGGEIRVPPAS